MIRNQKILILIIMIIILLLLTSCISLERLAYFPDVNQGNYLIDREISKLRLGMTKEQVVLLLGSPTMTDLFGSNTWFYVFYHQIFHKNTTQKMLSLTFSKDNKLINIIDQYSTSSKK